MAIFSTKGHHACEDRAPGDHKKAPFYCNSGHAFLGRGYYFWEDDLPYAKYWGGLRYKSNGKEYLVIEAPLQCDYQYFFDLVGVKAHVNFLVDVKKHLAQRKPELHGWPIGRVIEFLKRASLDKTGMFFGQFNYIMLRCNDSTKQPRQGLLFASNQPNIFEANPIYIVCVVDKRCIISANQTLVHKSKKGP